MAAKAVCFDLELNLYDRMAATARGRGETQRQLLHRAVERELSATRVDHVVRNDGGGSGSRQDSIDLLNRLVDHFVAVGDIATARGIEGSLRAMTGAASRIDDKAEHPSAAAWRKRLPSSTVTKAHRK